MAVLGHPAAPLRHWNAEGVEFRLSPADAEPEDRPPAGNTIEVGDFAGAANGSGQRQLEDVGADSHLLGFPGEGSETDTGDVVTEQVETAHHRTRP